MTLRNQRDCGVGSRGWWADRRIDKSTCTQLCTCWRTLKFLCFGFSEVDAGWILDVDVASKKVEVCGAKRVFEEPVTCILCPSNVDSLVEPPPWHSQKKDGPWGLRRIYFTTVSQTQFESPLAFATEILSLLILNHDDDYSLTKSKQPILHGKHVV